MCSFSVGSQLPRREFSVGSSLPQVVGKLCLRNFPCAISLGLRASSLSKFSAQALLASFAASCCLQGSPPKSAQVSLSKLVCAIPLRQHKSSPSKCLCASSLRKSVVQLLRASSQPKYYRVLTCFSAQLLCNICARVPCVCFSAQASLLKVAYSRITRTLFCESSQFSA